VESEDVDGAVDGQQDEEGAREVDVRLPRDGPNGTRTRWLFSRKAVVAFFDVFVDTFRRNVPRSFVQSGSGDPRRRRRRLRRQRRRRRDLVDADFGIGLPDFEVFPRQLRMGIRSTRRGPLIVVVFIVIVVVAIIVDVVAFQLNHKLEEFCSFLKNCRNLLRLLGIQ